MDPSDPAAGDVLEAQLLALDESDADPRALYRKLAEDPDQALELESELKELHARRLDLAQRVCLARARV